MATKITDVDMPELTVTDYIRDGQGDRVELWTADRATMLSSRAATAGESTRLARAENEATLRSQGAAALAANLVFLALPAPTNAQVLAQTKALTRQMDGLIRLANSLLDDTA